ncbi:DNA-methyltransferase [Photobacterium leiognathi]|uniref:DNA-methyltransferase n=1 Tax=Photobacterium leiognathi TaxID=553611 RepID=UPI0029826DC5|nr:site-specific DNA-methyltransferase [Photobacterium leiognathi]
MFSLMQGDCLEKMKEIPDGSVDMILCDPPYGTTACKWDSIIPLAPMWEQLKRIIKPNGAIVMTASQPFTTTLISSNLSMFKYCWVWEKNVATNFYHAKRQPLRKHEDIVIFYAETGCYYPQKTHGHNPTSSAKGKSKGVLWHGDNIRNYKGGDTSRYPTSIIRIDVEDLKKRVHPTQKPVALGEYLIKTYTNEGETVLDFTMGSGSFGVAAINLNRKFIGIELDKDYFGIATSRIVTAMEAKQHA